MFFSLCLLVYGFNSLFEMFKYETACITAPGMDCAELTSYSELHFEVRVGPVLESVPVVCVITSCIGSYPGNNCGRGRNLKED